MENFKRYIERFLLLAVFMAAMLAGCGKEAATGGNTADKTTDKTIKADASKWKDVFTLGEYKGIELPKLTSEVSDEELDRAVKTGLRDFAASAEVTEGTVEAADVVTMKYKAEIEGLSTETKDAYTEDFLSTESDIFRPNLVGREIGEKVTFDYTYPEEGVNEKYAGKKGTFTVKVISVTRYEYPELTDEFVAANFEMATAAQYMEQVKADLQAQKEEANNSRLYETAYNKILANSVFDRLPADEEERIIQDTLAKYQGEAEKAGQTLEEYVFENFQMEYPDFLDNLKEQTDNSLMDAMVWDSVAESAGIAFSEEEYAEYADSIAKQSGFDSVEAFEQQNGSGALEQAVFQNAAVDYVVKNAVLVEE